ncbi:MAG: hypothetical protein ACI9WU_003290, partial [Myxococcota bacterium]
MAAFRGRFPSESKFGVDSIIVRVVGGRTGVNQNNRVDPNIVLWRGSRGPLTIAAPRGKSHTMFRSLMTCLLVAVGLLVGAPPAEAQTVTVSASTRYEAGRAHRFTFGGGYRDLWEAQIELPLLNLKTVGGGLAPKGRFGGLQSAVLAFTGADGYSYTFRGTDKDPSAVLHPVLRKTVVREIVQDQMAAQHPAGPLVAAALSQAVGVLTIEEQMVVMPDDPALGKYRAEFAGMVGNFYAYPGPASAGSSGFHGATEVVDYRAMYSSLDSRHDRPVDAHAFLRARLLDLLLGDFDRHRKQWRWAQIPGQPGWQPIPEDRDQAFVRYDGATQRVSAIYIPILQCYGPDYPGMDGLTLHGWEQDRRLLTGLDWSEWKAVAEAMQARLTDSVVDAAVNVMPGPYVARDGDRLKADIRGRRDGLLDAARAFYEHLAARVDVHGTSLAERVRAQWTSDGALQLTLTPLGRPDPVIFSRRFDPEDTDEIRLYLKDGDDQVVVQGPQGDIVLRVIAGQGDKRLQDESGGTIVYDQHRAVTLSGGGGVEARRGAYVPPASDAGFVDVKDVPPRDWGYNLVPFPVLGYESDVGVVVGASATLTNFGFRKHPWASRQTMRAAFASEAVAPLLEYTGRFRLENSRHVVALEAAYSGIEVLGYYGLGNETSSAGDADRFRVLNRQFVFQPGMDWRFWDDRLRLGARLQLKHSSTRDGGYLINDELPYGTGSFGHLGAAVHMTLDMRTSMFDQATVVLPFSDNPAAGHPTGGVLVELEADFTPPLWDADATYGAVGGSLAAYAADPTGRFSTSVRLGGRYSFGKTPYFDAAYLNSGKSLSGAVVAPLSGAVVAPLSGAVVAPLSG